MPINIPILLTWLRIILIPALVGLYYLPPAWSVPGGRDLVATVVFVIAAWTDWLDGYLARRWKETSAFGACLDPVADKLMVAAALIILVYLDRVGALIAVVIIGREITISALREWMAQIGAHKSVAVSMIGKVKTAAQMSAIPLLLYYEPIAGFNVQLAGTVLMYVAAVLTLWSMVFYLRMAWPYLVAQDGIKPGDSHESQKNEAKR